MAVFKLLAAYLPRISFVILLLICHLSECHTSGNIPLGSLGSIDICRPFDSLPDMSQNASQIVTNGNFDSDSISWGENEDGQLNTIYEIKQIPNKDLGLIATRTLPAGTIILNEAPLISIPLPQMVPGVGFPLQEMVSSLQSSYNLLSPSQQEDYLSLHEFRFPSETDQDKLLTIFRSNAYNTGSNNVGLFPKIARINHDCTPNCGNYWSEKTGRRIIYTNREVKKGEEITVSYIPLLLKAGKRRERLGQYGFVCGCEACRKGEEGGDKVRVKVGNALESLEGKVGRVSKKAEVNEKLVKKAVELVAMIEDEGLRDYVARAFHLAAVFSERVGEMESARKWAMKELATLRLPGNNSDEALVAEVFLERLRINE
ncbi:hypothetical protein BGZ60DRAFT_393911 [Tricladium varicosporioides]|nr:hypothetical protein BGZ60DRAFT_393911 [Hymenoscyphus varicosporioides]